MATTRCVRKLSLCVPLLALGFTAAFQPGAASALDPPPLLPEAAVKALASEVSGTAAKRTAQDLTLFHRNRGSRGFRAAAERIRDRAREYGLQQVEVISLPADGKIFYGTQRSRPAWDVDFAELWEQEEQGGGWADARRIASWDSRPVVVAQDSGSGEAAAELVDIGAGTAERDYEGKEVRGRLVLTSSQPSSVQSLAVDTLGAAGIISYAPNQVTGWWREDETLVRWGHMRTFPPPQTFALMVSLQQARAWQERMRGGKAVRLRASVRAGQHPGSYDIVTAVIPGTDPAVGKEEIVFSCHLDHQRPGANDNASGCSAILEAGRSLAKLIREGKLAPPRRTLRWVWPPEIEGTISLLNARPDLAARARAAIHMDMVGGDAEITKAVFHVTRSPRSLPAFADDVAEELGRFVNAQSDAYAARAAADFPLVDPEGTKRPLQAAFVDFTEGSDHQVWAEGSWRVPAIYFNDWPDRYIHTHKDEIGNLDATKLLRAAFLGAANGYFLATLDESRVPALWEVIRRHSLERAAALLERRDRLRSAGQPEAEVENLLRFHFQHEQGVVDSIARFAAVPDAVRRDATAHFADLQRMLGAPANAKDAADGTPVYRRNPDLKGPMVGFGYGYLEDKMGEAGIAAPALLARSGLWGSDYAYEALNLVDGRRSVRQIRDALAAIYGPLPVEEVSEYLGVLERLAVIAKAGPRAGS